MEDWISARARIGAAATAMLAGSALFWQFALNVSEHGTAPLDEFARLYGFFTIWANSAVALIAGYAGLIGRSRGLAQPALLTASMVWIVVVGLVYNLLLAGLNHPPTPLRALIDHVFHVVTPLVWPLWWLVLRPVGQLAWRHFWAVLPVPLAYCAVALWQGQASGHYAYFFIDVGKYGWGQVVINIAGLAMLYVVLMLAAIAWDRRPQISLSRG
ncbi:MAG: Pr6Pr family membrane protein [Sphingomonadales bacterium]|jgi:hypothetical protein